MGDLSREEIQQPYQIKRKVSEGAIRRILKG